MITGDNPLTGSNIGFKCGIADKSKGMLICDFRDKKFAEEKFIYHEREEEEKPNETFEALINTNF
jgi:magnesium-transporting ATPase (P-type)